MLREVKINYSLALFIGSGALFAAAYAVPTPLLSVTTGRVLEESTRPAEPEAEAEAEVVVPARFPVITVSTVQSARLADRVIASGVVDAVEKVHVQPRVEGLLIEELLVDVGDTVAKGQVLARLSPSALEFRLRELIASRALAEAQIAQSEAALHQAVTNAQQAERQAARSTELMENGSGSRANADQTAAAAEIARTAVLGGRQAVAAAQAQLALVETQIANAELQLSYTEVRAPVSGLIVARSVQSGAVSTAAQSIFTIAREGVMELRAELAEQDLLRLKVGQTASLVGSEKARPVVGSVRLIEPVIDPSTRLGTGRIEIGDSSQILMGMFLQSEITIEEDETIAVPATAVRFEATGATVLRVENDVVERVAVSVGVRDDELIGILHGLAEGDLVVTNAAALVRVGEQIEPFLAEDDTLSVALAGGEWRP